MFNLRDLLGALTQAGPTRSTNQRMQNALGAGGKAPEDLRSGLFGGAGGGLGEALSKMLAGGSSGAIGGMLGSVLEDASRAVGGKRNLAVGGIGALAGALLGGGGSSMKGAIGGGVMGLLAIEVDTPAERAYLDDLGQRLGLNPETTVALEQTIGMQRA